MKSLLHMVSAIIITFILQLETARYEHADAENYAVTILTQKNVSRNIAHGPYLRFNVRNL